MAERLAFLFARPRSKQAQADGFELEWQALEALDLEARLIDFERLVDGEADVACARLPRGRLWVYRGWMLREEEYEALDEAIGERGGRLLVDADAYARAAYVPAWYPRVGDCSPDTRWIEGFDLDEAWEAACELGPGPWLVKDHLKSARDRWHHACFLPRGVERERFDEVCEALIEARGDRLERGLVFRRHVDLLPLGHSAPERPLFDEHRLFFVGGRLIAQAPYHDIEAPPLDDREVGFLGERVDSPFFSVDVARLASGGLTVIEVGDGGSSVLPAQLDAVAFYEAMAAMIGGPPRARSSRPLPIELHRDAPGAAVQVRPGGRLLSVDPSPPEVPPALAIQECAGWPR